MKARKRILRLNSDEIVRLYFEELMSVADIAKKFDCSTSPIIYRLQDRGVYNSKQVEERRKRKYLGIIKKEAERRGGKCLSSEFKTVHDHLEWECALGHRWPAPPRHVVGYMKSWCPECGKGYAERLCRLAFETIFNTTFPSTRPKWLLSQKGFSLELDGFSEKLNLAFEYNGEQHYKARALGVGVNNLKEIRKRDELKRKLCRDKKITLIIINYEDNIMHLPSIIYERIPKDRRDLLKYSFNQNIDYSKAYIALDKLNELRKIASDKGGSLLSSTYINIDYKYTWRCKNGHEWEAKADHIKNSNSWCDICANDERITNRKDRISFAKVQEIREKKKNGVETKRLISEYGVSKDTIYKIVNYKVRVSR